MRRAIDLQGPTRSAWSSPDLWSIGSPPGHAGHHGAIGVERRDEVTLVLLVVPGSSNTGTGRGRRPARPSLRVSRGRAEVPDPRGRPDYVIDRASFTLQLDGHDRSPRNTRPPVTADRVAVNILFKSARRQEYLQENLRILGANAGSVLKTTYSTTWVPAALVATPPAIGEPALIVFSSRPYSKHVPVRLATVTGWEDSRGLCRITLELGPRVRVTDPERWSRLVAAGPNPAASSGFFVREDRALELGPSLPVEVVPPQGELNAWKRVVDRLAGESDYARAVFLRVVVVEDQENDREVPAPYALELGRLYRVRLHSYCPNLREVGQNEIKLVPLVDELVATVLFDDSVGVPRDGLTELVLEPSVLGPGSLEIQSSRGAEFLFALGLDWMAVERRIDGEAAGSSVAPTIVPAGVAEEVPARVGPPVGASGSRELMEPPRREPAPEAAIRAFRLVRDRASADPGVQLELLARLLELVPGDPRLVEWQGVVLFEAGQPGPALAALGGLADGPVTPEGRAASVASRMLLGQTPDPIESIALADLTRDESFEKVLAASASLPANAQLEATRFVTERVLATDRASRWLEAISKRRLPRDVLLKLIELWQYVDEARAARELQDAIEEGRLGIETQAVADMAFELCSRAGHQTTALAAVESLVAEAGRTQDPAALEHLLGQARDRLPRDDFQRVGERIVHLVADVTAEDEPIDTALLVTADLLEDARQQGDLDRATGLAKFLAANERRASVDSSARLHAVLEDLERALKASALFLRYEELARQEANLDLRGAVAGLRFLLVGAKRPDWWEALRRDLAISDRSEWMESELHKSPPIDQIEQRLKVGRTAAVVLVADRIAHAVSRPLARTAKQYDVKLITTRLSREAVIAALREHFISPPEGHG
jgi:hypothetical protein